MTALTQITSSSTETRHEDALEEDAELAAAGATGFIEVAPIVLLGLLICPPLAILAVLVVVPLLVTALVLGLLAAILWTPYVLVRHFRGHHGHVALLRHRLRVAGRALLDLLPHRIHADARRLHPGR